MCGAGIAAIKYNLDGDLVAGASTNGSIYLYRVSRCGLTCTDAQYMINDAQLVYLQRNYSELTSASSDQFFGGTNFDLKRDSSQPFCSRYYKK